MRPIFVPEALSIGGLERDRRARGRELNVYFSSYRLKTMSEGTLDEALKNKSGENVSKDKVIDKMQNIMHEIMKHGRMI